MAAKIPVIGILPSYFATIYFTQQICSEDSPRRLAELVEEINEFKATSIHRNLASIVLIVSACALGVFGGAIILPTLLIVACARAAWMGSCAISQNEETIASLRAIPDDGSRKLDIDVQKGNIVV